MVGVRWVMACCLRSAANCVTSCITHLAVSQHGFAVVDDSASMLFTADDWVGTRVAHRSDIYLFAYGHDYRDALKALFTISGSPPVFPRWTLGNWWSRFCEVSHKYSVPPSNLVKDR